MKEFLLGHIRQRGLCLAVEAPRKIHSLELNYIGLDPEGFARELAEKFEEYRAQHKRTELDISPAGNAVYLKIRKDNQLATALYREMVNCGMAAKRRR